MHKIQLAQWGVHVEQKTVDYSLIMQFVQTYIMRRNSVIDSEA